MNEERYQLTRQKMGVWRRYRMDIGGYRAKWRAKDNISRADERKTKEKPEDAETAAGIT